MKHLPVLLVLLLTATAAPLVLVEDGAPRATIVLAARPTRAARLGALELQHHVAAITGAVLPIVGPDAAPEGSRLYLGAAAPLPADQRWEFLEYAVLRRPDGLVLAGDDAPDFGAVRYEHGNAPASDLPGLADAQGTLHAVYTFLERDCGVRWWNATEAGTELPRRATLRVDGEDLRRRPDFTYRHAIEARWPWRNVFSQCLWPAHSPQFAAFVAAAYPSALAAREASGALVPADGKTHFLLANGRLLAAVGARNHLWLLRNRFGGSQNFQANHSVKPLFYRFHEARPGREEFFVEEQPDWFAQGHEGPPNQLCYGSDEVLAQVLRDARAFFAGTLDPRLVRDLGAVPGSDRFPLVPSDGWGYCRCPRCLPQWQPDRGDLDFFANGLHSDYWFGFVNRVAAELRRSHPDKRIATLAYASYAAPPSFALEPNVDVQFCHAIRDPFDTATREHEEALLRAWARKLPGERRFLWLYYCFPREFAGKSRWRWHVFPGFFAHEMGRAFRLYRDLGYQGAFFNGWAEDIDTVLTLRLLEDADTSVDALLDDYFRSYYGAAAEPMQELYTTIEDLYCDPANYPAEREAGRVGHQTEAMAWGLLGTAANMQRLRELLANARAQAEDPVTRHRIDLFDQGFFSYMEAGRRKYEAGIARRFAVRGCRVPRVAPVERPPWAQAFALTDWYRPTGEPSPHLPLLRVLHDGERLHLRFDDLARPGVDAAPWQTLRLTFGPDLAVTLRANGEVQGELPVTASVDGATARLSLALADLGVQPGERLAFNALRLGPDGDATAWNLAPEPGWLEFDAEAAEPVADAVPATAPLAHWTFDEADGEVVRDVSGHGHHGHIVAPTGVLARRVPGVVGNALEFGGRGGGRVEVPEAPAVPADGPLTIELWLRFRPLMLRGNNMQGLIEGPAWGLQTRRDGSRLTAWLVDATGEPHAVNTQDFPRAANNLAPRLWTQVAMVWDGRTLRLYLNGRPHGPPVAVTGPLAADKGPLTFGRLADGRSFRGALDDISIHPRAMTPAEVRARFLAHSATVQEPERRAEDAPPEP